MIGSNVLLIYYYWRLRGLPVRVLLSSHIFASLASYRNDLHYTYLRRTSLVRHVKHVRHSRMRHSGRRTSCVIGGDSNYEPLARITNFLCRNSTTGIIP